MQYISGLFFRIDWLHVSHSLALNSAQAAQSVRNTQMKTIEQNYIKIVKVLKKANTEIEIYVQSVFPVAGDLYENNFYKRSEPMNTVVSDLNGKLSQLEGITFIDIADEFGDKLSEDYSVDGLHLNKVGYRVWLNEIERDIRE